MFVGGKPGGKGDNCHCTYFYGHDVESVSRECWVGRVGRRVHYVLPVGAPHWQVSQQGITEVCREEYIGIIGEKRGYKYRLL